MDGEGSAGSGEWGDPAFDPAFDPACDAGFDASVFDVPPPDALGLVLEVDGMVATFAAQRFVRVAALCRDLVRDAQSRGLSGDVVERSIRLELASGLRITEHAAQNLMVRGRALVERYPGMLDALHEGAVTERHAEILVDLLDVLDGPLRERLTVPAVVLARREPVGVFRRKLRHLIDAEQATTLAQRHRDAVARRYVVRWVFEDGMAELCWYGPAVDVQAAYERITRMGMLMKKSAGEARTRDQIRADVVGDLLHEGTVPGHDKAVQKVKATVVVTVPVLSLLDDEYARVSDPATVDGVGPIPIEKARELCGGSGDWMRVLTHPETGMVLSVGRDRYRPPRALRRLVTWRSGTCLAPGCNVPAERCQIDHNEPWADGGRTEAENHCPFCQGHHTIKGCGLWKVTQLPGSGGVMEWISPLGRRYLVEPERRTPTFTTTRQPEPEPAPPF